MESRSNQLIAKDDAFEVRGRDLSFAKTIANRMELESRVVFAPGKALFLSGCYNLSVAQQTRSAVVIASGYTENIHKVSVIDRCQTFCQRGFEYGFGDSNTSRERVRHCRDYGNLRTSRLARNRIVRDRSAPRRG